MPPASDNEPTRDHASGPTRKTGPARPVPATRSPDATLLHREEAEATRLAAAHSTGSPTLLQPGTGEEKSANASAPVPRVIGGRFEVVRLLGEGGMGRVFRVRDRQIEGREIALKVLRSRFSEDARFRQLFFQEIRAAQKFVSEHVIQVRDTGQLGDGLLFLTMDLVEGESLAQLLQRERSLALRHCLEITRQILLGLKSGHEHGFVHRDVKPSNVMLAARVSKTEENPHGVGVRLLDFGIAGLAAGLDSGVIVGTLQYMSPEQAQGQRLDARSDLFAVGIVLYEMLTGSRPFKGDTLQDVVTSVLQTNVGPLLAEYEHVGSSVQKLLRKALHKDREKRFQSASEFIDAIERSKAYRIPKEVPTWAAVALGVLGIAVAGEAAWIWNERSVQASASSELTSLRTAKAELEVQKGNLEQDKSHVAELLASMTTARNEMVTLRDQMAKERDAAVADRELANNTAESLRKQLSDEQSKRVDTTQLEAQSGDAKTLLATQLADAARERDRYKEDAASLQVRLEQLEQRNQTLEESSDPIVRMARGFDELCDALLADKGLAAEVNWKGIVANPFTFPRGKHGTEYVGALVTTGAELERYVKSLAGGSSADVDSLVRAREALKEARDGDDYFTTQAADWLNKRWRIDEPDHDRRARATEVLQHLASSVAQRDGELTDVHVREWTALASLAPDADPAPIFEHSRKYRCRHASERGVAFAQWLASQVERDGVLDDARLRKLQVLETWHAEAAGLDEAAERNVRLFWAAKQWYCVAAADVPEPEQQALRAVLAEASGDMRSDWRVALAIQTELARSEQCPLLLKRVHVFRKQDQLYNAVYWYRSWCDLEHGTSAGAMRTWPLKSSQYHEENGRLPSAGTSIENRVVRSGTTMRLDQLLSIDLRAHGADVKVVNWTGAGQESVPSRFGDEFPPAVVSAFRTELGPAGEPCLVVGGTGGDAWISPRYGMVRAAEPGKFLRELVCATD